MGRVMKKTSVRLALCAMSFLIGICLVGCNTNSIKDAPPSGITEVTPVESSDPALIEAIDTYFATEDLKGAYVGTTEFGAKVYFTSAGEHAMFVISDPAKNRYELYFGYGDVVGLNAKHGGIAYSLIDEKTGNELSYVSKLVNSDKLYMENGDGMLTVQRVPLIDMQEAARHVAAHLYPAE